MTGSRRGGPDPEEGAGEPAGAGLRRLEGYLLWQAEVEQARKEAEAMADRLDWLTSAQREAVVDCFAERQMQLSRRFLERTALRAQSLRGEYEQRYALLRARLCALTLLGFTAAVLLLCLLAGL
ncbi:hypothetical protein [Streptomyces sp. AD55]|uniref:hypothetical protein n=1 Tax=Streptomyces sp. AD55 TaxID=3242895 RepID=UPI003528BDEB